VSSAGRVRVVQKVVVCWYVRLISVFVLVPRRWKFAILFHGFIVNFEGEVSRFDQFDLNSRRLGDILLAL
jgi:hypothetical protein